jgi:hypothetical protein
VSSSRRARTLIASAVLAVSAIGLLSPTPPASAQTTGNADALQARVRAELAVFTGWLQANGAKGYIGEVGWPNNTDTAAWNALATKWYADASAAGLWTTAWSAGEWWGCAYKLSVYTWSTCATMDGNLSVPKSQASVIEAQTSVDRRGINMSGGDFGTPGPLEATSTFSNANPGAYNAAYHYDTLQSYGYVASRGMSLVRLPVRWERVQPVLGGALNAAEVQRISDAIGRADAHGMRVILDIHNYGAYWLSDGSQGVRRAIGSAEVTVNHFATLWRLLSTSFRSTPGLVGYGLMNEPVGMAGPLAWEQASQAAVTAIRQNGDTKLVLVPGYNWSGAQQWTSQHPRPWITDTAANVRYEAHHYWDRDSSGAYVNSYASEVSNAVARGYVASAPVTTTTVLDTIGPSTPQQVSAVSSAGRVTINWMPSTDTGGSGFGGYEVFRAPSRSGPFLRIAIVKGAPYIDAAVVLRSQYAYYVRAYDKAGNRSANSAITVVYVT